ncbi:hypothetical protein PR048_022325 [Dryococelus australis]|uniref:Uncharacterized protein n=1 Tax=Dryococelus australis TaxID=614101 RepID=A0ABQ9H0X9_9NEOP|nr:hypothetical protein PR048_022325 [Dryococelus australis]
MYSIRPVPSKQNRAYGLSRVPLSKKVSQSDTKEVPSVTIHEVGKEFRNDIVIKQVIQFVLNGWPEINLPEIFKHYHTKSQELTVENKCLMWGHRLAHEPYGNERQKAWRNLIFGGHHFIAKLNKLLETVTHVDSIKQTLEKQNRVPGLCHRTQSMTAC